MSTDKYKKGPCDGWRNVGVMNDVWLFRLTLIFPEKDFKDNVVQEHVFDLEKLKDAFKDASLSDQDRALLRQGIQDAPAPNSSNS